MCPPWHAQPLGYTFTAFALNAHRCLGTRTALLRVCSSRAASFPTCLLNLSISSALISLNPGPSPVCKHANFSLWIFGLPGRQCFDVGSCDIEANSTSCVNTSSLVRTDSAWTMLVSVTTTGCPPSTSGSVGVGLHCVDETEHAQRRHVGICKGVKSGSVAVVAILDLLDVVVFYERYREVLR